MKIVAISVIACCLHFPGCGRDECSDSEVGEKWCEDGKVMLCEQTGIGEALNNGVNKVVVKYDCEEMGSYCIEIEHVPHDYAHCASMEP